MSFGTVIGSRADWGRDHWQLYFEQSVKVPGPVTESLGNIAAEAGVYLVIGITEQSALGGSLYCSILYFDPEGNLIGKHRKLKPTGTERLIWAEGDGRDLELLDTRIGKMGGLICWENYMPLARMALYQQGIEIYLAPTADSRDSWQHTMAHIAMEGRCYVLGCNQFVTKSDYPDDPRIQADLKDQPDIMSRGGSVIYDPLGQLVAGPLFDQAGILVGELDMGMLGRSKMDFDVIGHYARPDVFEYEWKNSSD